MIAQDSVRAVKYGQQPTDSSTRARAPYREGAFAVSAALGSIILPEEH
jgi:hypothetical protein